MSLQVHPQTRRTRRSSSLIAIGGVLIGVLLLSPTCQADGRPAKGASGKGGNSAALAPAPAAITVPISSTTVCSTALVPPPIDKNLIDDILVDYENGNWSGLQLRLARVAESLKKKCTGQLMFSSGARISFALIDDHAPQPTVVRILEGTSPPPDLSSRRALNSGSLFTVYIYRDLKTPVFTTYTASPTASPVEAGVSQFISVAAGGLSKIGPASGAAKGANPLAVNCIVTRADVPKALTWAQLTLTDNVNVKSLLTAASVGKRVHDFQSESTVIKKLSATFADDFDNGTCTTLKDGAATADQRALAACQVALDTALNNTLAENIAGSARDAAMALYSMYTGIIVGTPQVSVQTTYTYGPLTRWAFGLGAGAMIIQNLHRQVKVAGGTLTSDSPSGALTSVNIYWSPTGYDETTLKPAVRELPRVIGGFVLTPNVGVFLGGGFALPFMRSVTVNGGYAVLLAAVPPAGRHVGDAVSATKRGALGAWIAELGYSF